MLFLLSRPESLNESLFLYVWWRVFVDMDMPACFVSPCVCVYARLHQSHMETLTVPLPTRPVRSQTHTQVLNRSMWSMKYMFTVLQKGLACRARGKKYGKRDIGCTIRFNRHTVQPVQQHSHTHISSTGTCIVFHSGTPAVTSAPVTSAAGLLYLFVQICVHVKVYVHTLESLHLSALPLTGTVLYLTFTLKS